MILWSFCISVVSAAVLAHATAEADDCAPGNWTVKDQPPAHCIPYPNGLFQKKLPNAGSGGPINSLAPNSDAIAQNMMATGAAAMSTGGGPAEYHGVPMYYGRKSDPLYELTSCSRIGTSDPEHNPVGTYWRIPNQAKMSGLGMAGDNFFTVWDQTTNKVLGVYCYNATASAGTLPTCTANDPQSACPMMPCASYCDMADYSTDKAYQALGDGDSLGNAPNALTIRQSEWISGAINHALYLVYQCEAEGSVFPAYPNSQALKCPPDKTNMPKHGSLLFFDYTDAQIDAMNLPAWQQPVIRALSHYGGYVGDTSGSGGSGIAISRIEDKTAFNLAGLNGPLYVWLAAQGVGGCTSSGCKYSLPIFSGIPDVTGPNCPTSTCNPVKHLHIADPSVPLAMARATPTPLPTPTPTTSPTPMPTLAPSPTLNTHPNLFLNKTEIDELRKALGNPTTCTANAGPPYLKEAWALTCQRAASISNTYSNSMYDVSCSNSSHCSMFTNNTCGTTASDTGASLPNRCAGGCRTSQSWQCRYFAELEQGTQVAAAGLAYQITRNESYATNIRNILMSWVTSTLAIPYSKAGMSGETPIGDLGFIGFAYAYDMTYNSPAWSAADKVAFENWLKQFVTPVTGDARPHPNYPHQISGNSCVDEWAYCNFYGRAAYRTEHNNLLYGVVGYVTNNDERIQWARTNDATHGWAYPDFACHADVHTTYPNRNERPLMEMLRGAIHWNNPATVTHDTLVMYNGAQYMPQYQGQRVPDGSEFDYWCRGPSHSHWESKGQSYQQFGTAAMLLHLLAAWHQGDDLVHQSAATGAPPPIKLSTDFSRQFCAHTNNGANDKGTSLSNPGRAYCMTHELSYSFFRDPADLALLQRTADSPSSGAGPCGGSQCGNGSNIRNASWYFMGYQFPLIGYANRSMASSSIVPTPSPWRSQDIGVVGLAGGAGYADGTFTVTGAGADIFGSADAFHFVYQELRGDGEIKARVTAVTDTSDYAKAGVMMRESLTPGARHALMAIKPKSNPLPEFLWRLFTSGSTAYTIHKDTSTGIPDVAAAPYWVRLVRAGQTLTGSISADGTTWKSIESVTFDAPLPETLYVGLAVSAANAAALNTSTFDNATVTPATAADTQPPVVSVTHSPATPTTADPVTFTATATDAGGIASVTITLDGATLLSCAASPCRSSAVTLAKGSHTYAAEAADTAIPPNLGGSNAKSLTVGVPPVGDNIPPIVSLTAPAAGTTVGGTVTLTATASDGSGVAGVQFLLDDAALGAEDLTTPYSVSWDTTTATNASYILSARARDAAGNVATSTPVAVTVDNLILQSGPTVSNITATTATITWELNHEADGRTDYDTQPDRYAQSQIEPSKTTWAKHIMTLPDLKPGTTYHYKVSSTDANDSSVHSGDFTFMTLESTPPPPPLPPPSTKFSINDRVRTNTANVSVRSSAGGAVSGQQTTTEALGTVIGGPTQATVSGATSWFWNINFDAGTDGWVAESFVDKAQAPGGQKNIFTRRYVYMAPRIDGTAAEITRQLNIMRRAAAAGYNGIILAGGSCAWASYFPSACTTNYAQIKSTAQSLGLALIPGYFSGSEPVYDDPTVAEAWPIVDTPFRVSNGTARIESDLNPGLLNGGMETWSGSPSKPTSWTVSGPATQDGANRYAGASALKFTTPSGSARISQRVIVTPWRVYQLGAAIKTSGYCSGCVRLYADGWGTAGHRSLASQRDAMTVNATQDWTQHTITFTSLDAPTIDIYLIADTTSAGSLWVDNMALTEVGLTADTIQRASTPVVVTSEDGLTTYTKGADYTVGTNALTIPAGSKITQGELLKVDWWKRANAKWTYSALASWCQPNTVSLARTHIKRILDRHGPDIGFMINWDEMGAFNWDPACGAMSTAIPGRAGEYLASVMQTSESLVHEVDPARELYVWNDMFDPYHNAGDGDYSGVAQYGKINGWLKTPTAAWTGVSPSTIVINWVPPMIYDRVDYRPSIKFWAGMDPEYPKPPHRQIIGAYYDNLGNVSQWMKFLDQQEADGVSGVVGFLYTTWQQGSDGYYGKYNDLEEAAKIIKEAGRWGTGPVPTTTSQPDTERPTVSITAPAAGSTVPGSTATVTAIATDNVAVRKVEFFYDTINRVAEVLTAPYTVAWNTAAVPNGSHTLTAKATDTSNNQTTSNPIPVMVNNQASGVTHPNLLLNQTEINELRAALGNPDGCTANAGPPYLRDAWNRMCAAAPSGTSPSNNYSDGIYGQEWHVRYGAELTDGYRLTHASLAHAITRNRSYADAVRAILLAWVNGTNANPSSVAGNSSHGIADWGLNGFALAYDLTYNSGVYSSADKTAIESWFANFVAPISGAKPHPWYPKGFSSEYYDNGFYGHFGYINEFQTNNLLYAMVGALLGDQTRYRWATLDQFPYSDFRSPYGRAPDYFAAYPGRNPRSLHEFIRGAIYNQGEATMSAQRTDSYYPDSCDEKGNCSGTNLTIPNYALKPVPVGSTFDYHHRGPYPRNCPNISGTYPNTCNKWTGPSAGVGQSYQLLQVQAFALHAALAWHQGDDLAHQTLGGHTIKDAANFVRPIAAHSAVPRENRVYSPLYNLIYSLWRDPADLSFLQKTGDCADCGAAGRGEMLYWLGYSWPLIGHADRSIAPDGIIPPTPLLITAGPSASNVTSTRADITWTLSEGATGQVEYGTTTPAYGQFTQKEETSRYTTHSQPLEELAPGTTYHYRVHSTSESGSTVTSRDATFTTLAAADTLPPTAPPGVVVTAADSTALQVAWTAATDNVALIGYQLDVSTVNTFASFVPGYANQALGNVTRTSVTGLAARTTYYARVRAADAAGNVSANSPTATGTTLAPPDTTPPAVSLTTPAAGTTVGGTVTLTATASDGSGVAGVQFLLDDAALGAEDLTTPYSVSWDTTTATNASYILSARARDAAGNVTTSAAVAVTVDNLILQSGPTVSNITATTATITWELNHEADGRTDYDTQPDRYAQSQIEPSKTTWAEHIMTLTDLTPGTTYYYKITSTDQHDSSITSAGHTFTTLAAADTLPPTAPPGVVVTAADSTALQVAWTAATDNVAVTGYQLDVSTVNTFASFVPGYANQALGNVTRTSVTGLAARTTYYARVRAADAAGNVSANSPTATGTTLAPPDTTPPTTCTGDYYVSTSGSDGNNGSTASPWKTIQKAADMVAPGRVVCVRAGTYNEEVRMKTSGTSSARITFIGADAPTTIVDAGVRFTGAWTQVPNTEILNANGRVWKRSLGLGNGSPHLATFRGKFINRSSEDDFADNEWQLNLTDGPSGVEPGSNWGGPRVRGWYGLAGKLAVPPGQQVVYIRLCGWSESLGTCDPAIDGKSPEGMDISFGTKTRQGFDLNGKSFITIKNFTVTGGYANIQIGDDTATVAANDNLIENVRVLGGQKGIYIRGGSARNAVRNNYVTMNPWLSLDPRNRYHWFWWDEFKLHGDSDAYGVLLASAGPDNVISGNVIEHVHDGINVGGSRSSTATEAQRLKVFGNTINKANDECLGIRGISPQSEWYDNTLSNCTSAVRLEALSANFGPNYIYRNKIVQPEWLTHLNADCFYMNDISSAEMVVYHNSCTGYVGFHYASPAGASANGMKIANNVFSASFPVNYFGSAPPTGVTRSHNWVTSGPVGTDVTGGGARMWSAGTDPGTLSPPWQASGAALNHAMNLSANNTICGTACPGMGGYYASGRYDIGAVQSSVSPVPPPAPAPTPATCAGDYYVDAMGSDTASGSSAAPFKTIQRALNAATAGKTICINPGRYTERVAIINSGTAGNPITLQCAAGAILDGGTVYTGGWLAAPEVGPNVYKSRQAITFAGDDAETLYYGDGTLANDYPLLKIADARDGSHQSPRDVRQCLPNNWASCEAGKILRDGPRGSMGEWGDAQVYSWYGVDGMWAFNTDTNIAYIRFADNRNMATNPPARLTFAPLHTGTITAANKNHITIRGCTITGANYAIRGSANADNWIIDNVNLRATRYTVRLEGADNLELKNSFFTYHYSPNYSLRSNIDHMWKVWSVFRSAHADPTDAILFVDPGGGNLVHDNTFFEHYGTIGRRGEALGGSLYVYNNTFDGALGGAIAWSSRQTDFRAYDNVIRDVNQAFRLGGSSGSFEVDASGNCLASSSANFNIFRNRIEGDQSGEQEGTCLALNYESCANIRFYHNSCNTKRGVGYSNNDRNPDDGDTKNTKCQNGWPNTRIVNNAFSDVSGSDAVHGEYYWGGYDWPSGCKPTGSSPSWVTGSIIGTSKWPRFDYNYLTEGVGAGQPNTGGANHNVYKTNADALWSEGVLPGVLGTTPPQSYARAVGKNVTLTDSILGMPYVGFLAGYFTGNAPDMGAVQSSGTPPTPTPTPLTITAGPSASNVTSTKADIIWTLSEPAAGQVDYGTMATRYDDTTTSQHSATQTHTITGLQANTTYHYQVRATSPSGSTVTSRDAEFTTLAAPDTQPPTVSLTAPAAGTTVGGTVTLTATASDAGGVAGVQFLLDGATLGAEDLTAPYSVSWDTTTATNASHTLAARARDAAGNVTTSTPVAVTVDNLILQSGPTVSNITATTATITWELNHEADGRTDYDIQPDRYAQSQIEPSKTTWAEHIMTLIDLTPGTTYYYKISSTDQPGSSITSAGHTFTTAAASAPAPTLRHGLTMTKAGAGTIASSPAGITCGSDCAEEYLAGTAVTLTAAPSAGSLFTGWSGACTGSGSCTLTMDAAKAVTATFTTLSTGATYYIAPNGSDANSGLSLAAPKKSFSQYFNASKPLKAGDALILMDGTYTPGTTGLPDINCTSNANNGTAAKPITIKTQNERKAFLKDDGSHNAFRMQSCSYYNIIGLRGQNRDLGPAQVQLSGGSAFGHVFSFESSSYLTIQRNIGAYPNRYRNAHPFRLVSVAHSLVEENEAYYSHRHSFTIGTSDDITLRRNYANTRDYPELSDGYKGSNEGLVFYDSSNSRSENNMIERTEGYEVHASYSTVLGNQGGQNNLFQGDIAHHSSFSGPDGRSYSAQNNVYRNVLFTNGLPNTIAMKPRTTTNTLLENVTIFNSGGALFTSNSGGLFLLCGQLPAPGCTFTARNVLSFNNQGSGIWSDDQASWRVEHSNSVGNTGGNYRCTNSSSCITSEPINDTSGNIRNSLSVAPTGMGLGDKECIAWVPAGSNMKGAGKNGADIGANILYRYQDGVLTNQPLWNTSTGAYPCGATVSDTSDSSYPLVTNDATGSTVATEACGNVHIRLNINTHGCLFPAGYGQGVTPPPPPAPVKSYAMPQTGVAPVIDGRLDEFAAAPALTLTNSGGTTSTYRLLWDATSLYVAAQVRDTDLRTATGAFWNEDGLELFFDPQHNGGIALAAEDRKVYVNLDNRQGGALPIRSAVQLQGTLNDTGGDTGYTIEVAIPWTSLGVSAPAAGTVWGLDLSLNDRQGSASTQTAWANTTGGGFNDPDGWGQGTFAATLVNPAPIDTMPPRVTLTAPIPGALLSGSAIAVTATASDNVGVTKVQFTRDGAVVAEDASSPYEVSLSVTDGPHALTAVAWDGAGLSASSASVNILIDTSPPVLSNGAPRGILPSNTTSIPLSLDTDEDASCRYGTMANTSFATLPQGFTTTGGQHHAVTLTGLVAGQRYTYYVRCEDKASPANATTADYAIIFTIAAPDTTPPTGTITINAGATVTKTPQVTLVLAATDDSGRVTQMQLSSDGVTFNAPEPYATSKAWTLTGADGLKTVAVRFLDAAGNRSATSRGTITLDTTAPALNGLLAQLPNPTSATITWTTAEPATTRIEYGLTTTYGQTSPINASLTVSHTVTVTNLTHNMLYYYRAISKDAAGNVGTALGSFRTPAINLAPNSSFETDPKVDYFTNGVATYTWTGDAAHAGARSVKIVSTQSAGVLTRWLSQNSKILVTPGKTYEVAVWVKTSGGLTNQVRLAANYWDATIWTIVGYTTEVAKTTSTTDWTQLVLRCTAPSTARYLRVEARLYGPGTLWVDDISVQTVNP